MTTIYDFPREWYDLIATQKFRPRSKSQVSPRTWTGGSNVSGPLEKMWLDDVTMAPTHGGTLQDMKAFISQLSGQAGILRMADSTRAKPFYDRNLKPTTSTFSDGYGFTDGTGFANGYLPPEVFVATAAARGASYIVLGGFPASTADVFRSGDLLEIKPNGVAATFPHLYDAGSPCSSDASGQIGIRINIPLRQAVAAGDVVSLRYASSLFRLIDDTQGDIEDTGGGYGSYGFSIAEALDLVP